jgi:hypothetical protein
MDLLLGAALRAAFLHTTLHTTGSGAVPTTDVDHAVAVRGAAAAGAAGSACAPYADPSFRYPPTVAGLAAPALGAAGPGAAKALYCVLDLAIAALTPPPTPPASSSTPRLAWALNPLSAALAARGSSDAAAAVAVLLAVRGVKAARAQAEGEAGKEGGAGGGGRGAKAGRPPSRALAAAATGGAALGAAAYHRLVPAMHALPLGAHLWTSRCGHGPALVAAFLAGAAMTGAAATAATLAACGGRTGGRPSPTTPPGWTPATPLRRPS